MSSQYGMRHRVRLSVFGLVALCASAANAQTACPRCLAGHRFLPSAIVNDPFATTHFVNATGGGMAYDLRIPVRNLEGDTITTFKGDIGFLLVDFEYQLKIAPWLALRATATGAGRVGTSAQAVLASGVSAAFGGSLGATVPVWNSDQFLVALDGTFRRSTEYDIDPFGFVREVVDSGYINDGARATLLSSEKVNRWLLGAQGAWGIRPWVGVTAQIQYGGVDDESADGKSVTSIGTQVGFDIGKVSSVPLGISLAYRNQAGPGRTGNLAGGYRTAELGLYYTGREAFMVGADFFWSKIAVRDEEVPDLKATQFRLVTRIDF